ncbi:MAG: hypothetical protein A4E63_03407 [Syntrophorhabdus sp. PtaU1.Bin050]|nr:MAG: hypothetical protein A4E63_03407 [Syntrophorhabdus sp. PtaU1.Bin050]
MSRIPSPFHRIDTAQPGISSLRASRSIPDHQQSCRSLPQGGTNLCGNRIPSTIPFPRQAPYLTRLTFLFVQRSSAKIIWFAGIVLSFAKISGIISVSPRSPFACAGPISGTPGTTHRHVTGPQVVPQCSLQEQPSVHSIPISHRFSSTRERAAQRLRTSQEHVKGSCSCTIESNFGVTLQKIYLPRFFLPDSRNRRGESGLSGRQHGRNGVDVDDMRVFADRRRTERTSEDARRSRSPQMDISIMPVPAQEKITVNRTISYDGRSQ